MKKIISVFVIIALLFTLTTCGNSIGTVTPDYSSDIHTRDDIEAAIKVAKYYFIKEFEDCKLLTITYGGDEILESYTDFTQSGDIKDVIVLVSSFYVSPDGGDGSLNQDDIYTDWKWIIVRDADGNWVHRDHGYA